MSELLPNDFTFLADLLLEAGGMVVEPDKQYLISTRLTPVANRHGLADLTALVAQLRTGNDIIKHDVVDAMTVNETSFFRDPRVWSEIGAILLPQLFEACRVLRRLDVWVAASSSGQEVYTLAMLLKEVLGSDYDKWRIQLIASDLSREMVQRTREGRYSDYEVSRGLSTERRDRFMYQDGKEWVVNADLRALVKAREGNLTSQDMGVRGPFDLILLRNVLIYFKPDMRTDILSRQADLLNKNGRLILGASEGALGVPPTLKSVRTGSLVSYGRTDSDVEAKSQPRSGLSDATAALLAQFPRDKAGDPTGAAASTGPRSLDTPATPLTPTELASKLSALPSTPRARTPAPSTPTTSPRPNEPVTPATSANPPKPPGTDQGSLLGSAKVDEDGLTPLERLRALRKEYQK